MVKSILLDTNLRHKYHLTSVNSINWARILAQIVYYFYGYFSVTSPIGQEMGRKVVFSVPTGNFGDILAGFYAQQMGLPIERLLVATNANDILRRFFETGPLCVCLCMFVCLCVYVCVCAFMCAFARLCD